MSEEKLIEVAKWLNSKGYHIEFETDELWMEDEITEHRFRDLCELLDEYAKSYTLQVAREAYNDVVSNRKQTGIAPYDDGFVTGLSYLPTIIESKLTEDE